MKNKLYIKQKQQQRMTVTRAVMISAAASSGAGLIFAILLFMNVGGIKDALAATDITYYSRSSGDWNDKDTWSTQGLDGKKAGSVPGAGDVVFIEGYDVRVNRNEKCKALYINGSSSKTTFTIASNKTLEVTGDINIDMKGNRESLSLFVDQNGALKVAGDFNVVGDGSAWTYLWFDNSRSEIAGDINLDARNKSGIMYYTYGNAITSIGGNVKLAQSGQDAVAAFKMDDKSEAEVNGDISFSADGASKAVFLLTANSLLKLKGTINRKSFPDNFGLFLSKDSSSVVLNGSEKQVLSASAGAGLDGIFYNNIRLNNTSPAVPQVTLEGTVNISGNLSFERGVIETTKKKQIAFTATGGFEEENGESYILGPGGEQAGLANIPLPVDLITYDVKSLNNEVVIAWATASELNNEYFVLERSRDGEFFNPITTIKGAGTSLQAKKYAFVDKSPLSGTSYYQLRQIDINGVEEVFPVKHIYMGENLSNEPLRVNEIGPNPFISQFSLRYQADNKDPVNLQLMNLNGKLLYTTTLKGEELANAYTFFEGADLESGIYFLVLEQNGTKVTRKLMKRG